MFGLQPPGWEICVLCGYNHHLKIIWSSIQTIGYMRKKNSDGWAEAWPDMRRKMTANEVAAFLSVWEHCRVGDVLHICGQTPNVLQPFVTVWDIQNYK